MIYGQGSVIVAAIRFFRHSLDVFDLRSHPLKPDLVDRLRKGD
jgi:hypothetical protein